MSTVCIGSGLLGHVGFRGVSVLDGGLEVEGVVGALVVVPVDVRVEMRVGLFEREACGFMRVVFVAEGALHSFDVGIGFGGAGWNGDEGYVEGLACRFERAFEFAAIVNLNAANGVGPGIEQFMEERFRIAARGTAREACVHEPAGGIDGGEVHAGASRVTAFVQRVDLNVLSRMPRTIARRFAAGVHSQGSLSSHLAVLAGVLHGLNDTATQEGGHDPSDRAAARVNALPGEEDSEFLLADGVNDACRIVRIGAA